MNDEQLENVLRHAQIHRYGRGERLIQEGDQSDSMFIMLRGEAAVSVAKNGTGVRVGVMRQGDCFGEISLLTGEPRSATVRAEGDCEVMEISKPVMAEVLRDSPQCLTALSELLAKRRLEGDNIVKDAPVPDDLGKKEREYRASFLSRLRTVFEL
jgi:CRP-like cAMP-binding protein